MNVLLLLIKKNPALSAALVVIGALLAGGLSVDALTPEQLGTLVDLAGKANWKQVAIAAALYYIFYRMDKKEEP